MNCLVDLHSMGDDDQSITGLRQYGKKVINPQMGAISCKGDLQILFNCLEPGYQDVAVREQGASRTYVN